MNILFVAYQEASNPLMMYSQGFPYIFGLSDKGADFSVLTYENAKSLPLSKAFSSRNSSFFKWYFLSFTSNLGFLSVFFDIFRGVVNVFYIILRDNIEIVHARGLIAGMISFLPVKALRRKLVFDTRGLLADKYSSGKIIIRDSYIYKIMKAIEKFLLGLCDFFTVETEKHSKVIGRWLPLFSSKKAVIPCCVDLNFFKYGDVRHTGSIPIVYLGKIGTWHMVEEMFDFFKVAVEKVKDFYFLFLTPDDVSCVNRIAESRKINLAKIKVINPARAEIPYLLNSAGAGIFFINPDHGYNSSHVKFGEYLACGLSVIVNSGIGDTATIIEKEKVGIVVKGFSESEYEDAVYRLNNILSQGIRLRQKCRIVAEKYFSLESGIEKYWQIYQKLIRK